MKDTDNQSWLDLIGKGFWLGVGFTVAFVIVTTIFTLLYAGIANVYMEREAAAMTRATEEQLRILRNAFQQTLPKVVKPSVQTQVKPEGAVRYFGKPKQLKLNNKNETVIWQFYVLAKQITRLINKMFIVYVPKPINNL